MTDIRMIVSWGLGTEANADWMSNTLYFSADQVGEPDYQDLANDLRDIYALHTWTTGMRIEVRAYNMADETPRPEKAFATVTRPAALLDAPHQVALCLSYFSERNLPRQRGRIYVGPWSKPGRFPTADNLTYVADFGEMLADLGGINVDWSVYSPTKAAAGQDATMSISEMWIDNSWDIQRRRKEPATTRVVRPVGE